MEKEEREELVYDLNEILNMLLDGKSERATYVLDRTIKNLKGG